MCFQPFHGFILFHIKRKCSDKQVKKILLRFWDRFLLCNGTNWFGFNVHKSRYACKQLLVDMSHTVCSESVKVCVVIMIIFITDGRISFVHHLTCSSWWCARRWCFFPSWTGTLHGCKCSEPEHSPAETQTMKKTSGFN